MSCGMSLSGSEGGSGVSRDSAAGIAAASVLRTLRRLSLGGPNTPALYVAVSPPAACFARVATASRPMGSGARASAPEATSARCRRSQIRSSGAISGGSVRWRRTTAWWSRCRRMYRGNCSASERAHGSPTALSSASRAERSSVRAQSPIPPFALRPTHSAARSASAAPASSSGPTSSSAPAVLAMASRGSSHEVVHVAWSTKKMCRDVSSIRCSHPGGSSGGGISLASGSASISVANRRASVKHERRSAG